MSRLRLGRLRPLSMRSRLDHTSPKRKRGKRRVSPRLRFGLVWKRSLPRLRFGLVFKRSALGSMVLGLLLIGGCTPASDDRSADGRLPVFAGIPPLGYLIEQVGGEHVKVDVLVQPGQDPHSFEPTPRQVLALGKAAIFFKIDIPFENALLEKVRQGSRRLEIVDAAEGVKRRWMDAPCCEQSAGRNHARHSEKGEPDPHVWLSPPLLKTLAGNVASALCRADPPHKSDYRRNLAALVARLDAVDENVRRLLSPYRGRSFYVFHPGFGYFADAYGLREEAIEAGGREPTPKQQRALIEKAKADGVTTVFVQPQYAPESARAVAEAIGGKVVTLDGLRRDPIADIEDIAAKVNKALMARTAQRTKEH
jgi:zinc transport system substrate-binding protein